MNRALSVALVALGLVACADQADDGWPTDAELEEIYAQPFALEGCRAGDSNHWLPTPGSLPSAGTWRVRWRCISDCRGTNAPTLTTADAVDITAGSMRFRRGTTVVQDLAHTTTGNCRIVQPSASPCRSAIRVCGSSRCNGGDCAEVTYAAWGQADVTRATAYEAILVR